MKNYRVVARFLSICLALVGCAPEVDDEVNQEEYATSDTPSPTPAQATSAAKVHLSAVPSASVDIALAMLEGSMGTDATPEWNEESELEDAVYVYHRLDVTGPAYYEFGVSSGGRILVATGKHDVPVPAFSDTGKPNAARLHENAVKNGKAIDRLYQLGPLLHLAVDANDQIVSNLDVKGANQPTTLNEYAKLVLSDDAAQNKTLAISSEWRSLVDTQWQSLYDLREKAVGTEGKATLAVTSIKWLWHKDLLRTSIQWSQTDQDTSAKVCWAGCGTVAWAQVAAYLAQSDRWGNPKYAGSGVRKLYPDVPLTKNTPQALSLIANLHNALDSVCWPSIIRGETGFNTESAVAPWDMDDFPVWAKTKGANVRYQSSWGGPWGGDETGAWNALRAGNPVVFGWKYTHYTVGAGTALLNSAKYIWVNNGWGGNQDGWLLYDKNAMFYSGIVQSWVAGK